MILLSINRKILLVSLKNNHFNQKQFNLQENNKYSS